MASGEVGRRFDRGETGVAGEDETHLVEIIVVIGAEVDGAARSEDAGGEGGEAIVNEAVLVMLAFGPWIREIDVERCDGVGGEEKLEEIGGFDPKQAEVGEIAARGFAIRLAQAPEEPFDAENIVVGVGARVMNEESAVATAEFDFERLLGGEKEVEVNGREDGIERMDERSG
jgi:hypothetical protein